MGVRIKSAAAVSAVAVALAAALTLAPAAQASFPSVYGGDLSCSAQPASGNVRLCSGPTTTWDGQTKIDVNVILPPEPASGGDGPYPLIGDFHGWGGEKIGINAQTQGWAQNGYAVFSMSDRGWGNSCGAQDPDRIAHKANCEHGYNHLMDDRYEVRDAQYLISVLADEGVAQPQRIGATGVSYGGGLSMALAALRDRTMLPDGSLVPWKSPAETPMAIAAAVPQWPWSDLAYSLMPNGRTLDYVADAPYLGPDGKAKIGIEKSSYVSGLYGTGQAESNYALPGTDPGADLVTWFSLISAGEPYDSNPAVPPIISEITSHHSSYYIDHSQPPAPLLIQSGWNDDLFPADEALRYYNRTRSQFPGDPISLFFMDDGHARSQNKQADVEAFELRQNAWFDHFLKGSGAAPHSSVEALTTTCGTPSAGPYTAATWKALAPGEIRLDGAAAQTVVPGSGNPAIGQAFDPIAGGGACATAPGADQAGVANYRLSAPAGGFTLLGSPTVVADVTSPGPESELAARLLDVSPGGTETLVARGLLRPDGGGTKTVFQLHPQAYRFAAGDIAKLELLPSDAPYARPSNAQAPITISNLQLRLPVLEQPGSLGGVVQPPAPPVIPPGYQPAIDYRTAGAVGGGGAAPISIGVAGLARGRILATGRELLVRLRCSGSAACSGTLTVSAQGRGKHRSQRTLAKGPYSLQALQTSRLKLPLTKAGRALVGSYRRQGVRPSSLRARLAFEDSGRAALFALTRPVHLKR
ncbi:MAG: type transport system ATP-binding protein [Solirubrobacterales bacterium]|jgi:predicted acyl esterase|nr:type transport system ATP-binding protein [Solirubrobacterales bacterium]